MANASPLGLGAGRIPSIGNLIKTTWQVYTSRFWVFLGVAIFPIICMIALTGGFAPWIFITAFFSQFGPIIVAILLALATFAVVVLNLWSSCALLCAIRDREAKAGIKEAFSSGWSKILPFLWVSILSSFIIAGGMVLFIIPGFIFAFWFVLSSSTVIGENLKGMNVLFRSKQLMSGNWGEILSKLFVAGILVSIVSWLFGLLFKYLGQTLDALSLQIIGVIGEKVISFLLAPLGIIFPFLVYEDLKKAKESIPFEAPKKSTKVKLIIVAIVGGLLIPTILVLITINSLNGARVNARDARRSADLSQIRSAAEMYYMDYEVYPTSLTDLSKYFPELPRDPKNDQLYSYKVLNGGNDFEVCANFEKIAARCINSYGYQASPGKVVEEETGDWRTYQNAQYGFEFQYSQYFAEDADCSAKILEKGVVSVGSRIFITVQDAEELSLLDNANRDLQKDQDIMLTSNSQYMVVGNKEAIKFNYYLRTTGRNGQSIYLLKDNNIYKFAFTDGEQCPIAYEKNISENSVFDKIIETFKFSD